MARIPLYRLAFAFQAPDAYALVDDDIERVIAQWVWRIDDGGYAHRCFGDYRVYLHHFVIGHPLKGYMVDHANGDRLDDRRVNLRITDATGNARNTSAQLRNKSGVLGVHKATDRPGYRARISVGGRKIHIGYFATLEEARAARRAAELMHFGEYAPALRQPAPLDGTPELRLAEGRNP